MREIKIDFDNPGFPQRLDVVENDAQSRFFKAVLYKDGKAYAAPSGATYSIMYRGFGPQNEGWYDTINDGSGKRAACSVSGNVVTCEIARQALRVPGHVSVVLCVTGSNGYMLHGWPIDCNCRNDSYTGGTSVESFFYITQVTNADWTAAIRTWEELKNMIDPTLSLSGKAADAAKVGEAVNAEVTRAKAAEEENAKGVSQLKEDLVYLQSEEYFEENKSKLAGNESIINDASSFNRNWNLASTTAIMQGIPITNAIKLKSVKYNVGETSIYQAHHIGLCTINGNTATITHVKRNAGYLKGVVTLNVDFELDYNKEYYLFIICDSGIVQWTLDTKDTKYYTFTNPTSKEVGTAVSITTISGNSVDIGEMDIVYKTDGNFITKMLNKSGTIVVSKENGDYTTLTEALANANDSIDNPVTIILYPGVYEEHLTILNRYISIIGVNRDTCIIRNDSGKYNNDPIKISGGKWRLENISLISTHSKAGSWVPSWNFPDLPSYALHIDNGSANGFGVVNNCFLYCENLNTIGAGTHNGETIRIENCQIVRNTTDPNYISNDYKGAVACHSPNIYDNTETESHFNMYNCEIVCNLDKALQLKHLSSKAKMKSIMVGNTLTANGSVTDVVNFAGSHTDKTDYIEIQSHGNSTTELNY